MLGSAPLPPTPSGRRLLGPVLTAALVVGALAGCSDEPDDRPTATPTSASASASTAPEVPAEPVVRTTVRTGQVAGQLTKKRRSRLVREVASVTDRWFDAAYVAGDYPRTHFKKAFPGFTTGATRTARGDRDLMTNADLGKRIDGVTVKRRMVTVDLLAVGGRARAATARVHLAFTTGGAKRRVRVTGRLFLTQHNGRWRIFGYDVAKGRS